MKLYQLANDTATYGDIALHWLVVSNDCEHEIAGPFKTRNEAETERLNTMTTFDALVNMAQMTLRARKQWHSGATAYTDIDAAVNGCADLLRGDDMPDLVSLGMIESAISEIKRRGVFNNA